MINLYELACLQAYRDLPRKLPRVAAYIEGQPIHFSTPFKALELWQTLLSYRPRQVLEIGCGMTTCVFALYAKEYGANIVSTEDKAEYRSNCLNRLGELAQYAEIHQANLIVDGDDVGHFGPDGFPAFQEEIRLLTPDLLYVDGPANIDGKLRADARNLVSGGTEPGLIMFDYSIPAVTDFTERFSDKYRIDQAIAMNKDVWYLSGLRHHSFAWRR